MNSIATKILPIVLGQLIKLLSPTLVAELVGKVLDALENAIKKSPNKIDDSFIPLIEVVRAVIVAAPAGSKE